MQLCLGAEVPYVKNYSPPPQGATPAEGDLRRIENKSLSSNIDEFAIVAPLKCTPNHISNVFIQHIFV